MSTKSFENEIKPYVNQYDQFTDNLLAHYLAGNPEGNVVFSPFSILMLMAIAADATAGGTQSEITRAFPFALSHDDTIRLMGKIQSTLTESPALSSANAVCVQDRLKASINRTYARHLRTTFSGELFSSPHIVSDVNKWVKRHTGGLIDRIADESMKEKLAVLMNAIAYASKWLKPYKDHDIYDEEFTDVKGNEKEVPMLHSSEHCYIESADFTGFVKDYRDEDYSFMALLPKNESPAALTEALKRCNFTDLFASGEDMKVYVTMPEFSFSFEDDLTAYFRGLGIERLFSDAADFSPLTSEWIRAEAILHKARIEVDREGTKAAAVTGMIAVAGCIPSFDFKTVELNRPFVFSIMHNKTRLPVFTGVVNTL